MNSMDFFTFDNTCDPLQPTGTIIFTVPPLFAGCAASLEAAILEELAKLKIKTGAIIHEEHPVVPAAQVMRIQIVGQSDGAVAAAGGEHEHDARHGRAARPARLPVGQRTLRIRGG